MPRWLPSLVVAVHGCAGAGAICGRRMGHAGDVVRGEGLEGDAVSARGVMESVREM